MSGCVAAPLPLVGVLTLEEAFSAVSFASSLITGKSFGEHAMDIATGQDCRILESVLRPDRKICEPVGSVTTSVDYKGITTLPK